MHASLIQLRDTHVRKVQNYIDYLAKIDKITYDEYSFCKQKKILSFSIFGHTRGEG